jgi:hypothetical protein
MVRSRLTAVLLVSAAPASAADPPALAPDSPWNVVYDDDSCALRRTFGEGDQGGYLEIRKFAPDVRLQVLVAGRNLNARDLRSYEYRWGNDPEWHPAGGLKITLDDGLGGMIFLTDFVEVPDDQSDLRARDRFLRSIDWRAIEREAAARVSSLSVRGKTIRNRPRGELRLQTGTLAAPLDALNTCVDELMTHWDIDVEAHKTLSRGALPIDMAAAASMVGYPPKMVRQAMPGLVNVRLAIDETGRVTACRIQMPLSDPEFEESSCADIQHAFEFEPALDKDGEPIASYWTTRVVFQIATRTF